MCAMPMPPACPGGQLYTVARGDTLFLIAQRFNTTVAALRAANPQITNQNVLVVGQQLCIPGAAAPPGPLPPACPGGTIVTVAPGETMSSIARRFGLGLQQLIAANPQVIDPNVLLAGQRICVPAPTPTPPPPTCPVLYIVVAGDTMAAIARRFGVSLQALINANPQIADPNVIQPGQRVCIPIAPPGTPTPPACPEGTLHTVAPGETMFAIAQRSGLTLSQLLRANPQVADPNVLLPGQVLCIPPRP